MEDILIISIIFGSGALIALTAILTTHKRSSMKLQIQMLEKEAALEQIRLEGYQLETEKMRLELEHSKQLLLETRND
jgi:acyl-CoA hydrolase